MVNIIDEVVEDSCEIKIRKMDLTLENQKKKKKKKKK